MLHLGTIGSKKEDALHMNLAVARGEPFYVVVDFDGVDGSDDWTLKMQARKRNDGTLVFDFNEGASLSFDDPTQKLTIIFSDSETASLEDGIVYDYDVRVRVAGANSSILLWGTIKTETWVTRDA